MVSLLISFIVAILIGTAFGQGIPLEDSNLNLVRPNLPLDHADLPSEEEVIAAGHGLDDHDADILLCLKELASENELIINLLDDTSFINDLFKDDACYILSEVGIWSDIDTSLYQAIEYIIDTHIFHDFAGFGIDPYLVESIEGLFKEHDFLLDPEVRLDFALNALKWLTARKIAYGENGLDSFCINGNVISSQMSDELINLLHHCVLFNPLAGQETGQEEEEEEDQLLDIDIRIPKKVINKTRAACEYILSTNRAFTMEFTKQLGVFVVREWGHGIYGILAPDSKIANYTVSGTGGGIGSAAPTIKSLTFYKYETDKSGDDLMQATGKWIIGYGLGVGVEYGIIKGSGGTIAHSYTLSIIFGLQAQFPVYIKYLSHNKNITLDVNLTKFCNYFTASPTTGPTIQPQSGSIDFFGVANKNNFVPINGNWSNISSTQTINPILTNYDDNIDNELDTIWVGTKLPSSLSWQNYSVTWNTKFYSDSTEGITSAGVIFGTQSNTKEAIYVGIKHENITLGTFNADGEFTLISVLTHEAKAIKAHSNSWISLKAYFIVYDETTVYVSVIYGALGVMDAHITNNNFVSGGSVGFRTINMEAQYNELTVTFNETYSNAQIN